MDIISQIQIALNTNISKYNVIKYYIYTSKHNRHEVRIWLSNFQT